MQVLALVTQKGGTGKSSLAISLAVAAQERGLKSAIIDIDPQGTASEWYQRRKAAAPEVARLNWTSLASQVHAFEHSGHDLVIVDTPGADDSAAAAAVREADFCLIPARPSIADIEAMKPTLRYLNERSKPFAFILNQCPVGGRTSRTSNAFRALQLIGGVCEGTVALRADHMDALAGGLGVTEHAPAGKAAAELRKVLDWVL
ncbi:MAG TPA: ParA family protein [Microvirga sp.]|nr:ParA family protein [Microvirga sp.]